jgi:hypothetical protein
MLGKARQTSLACQQLKLACVTIGAGPISSIFATSDVTQSAGLSAGTARAA